MVLKNRPPMLDYITKLMLLESVKSLAEDNPSALIWINTTMTDFYYRWRELDEQKK